MTTNTEFLSIEAAASELIECGAVLNSWGHTPATSSNFSIRLAEDSCLVTASGKHKGRLKSTDFVVVDLHGDIQQDLAKGQKASAETLLHTQIYSTDTEIKAVLHSHSPATTLYSMRNKSDSISISGYELLKAFPRVQTHETEICIPVVDNSQDMKALAQELSTTVFSKAKGIAPRFPGYIIRGHGIYVWGDSSEQCLNYLEAVEYLLNIIIQGKTNG